MWLVRGKSNKQDVRMFDVKARKYIDGATLKLHLKRFLLVVVSAHLMACSSADNSDLHSKLREIKSRPAGKIPPLPDFKPYQTFLYSASDSKDPFKMFDSDSVADVTTQEAGVASPSSDRNPEALEQYPLDTLRYVGQLVKDGDNWAIITSPDFIVHRVKVGNYLGQNYGKITVIEDDKILIVEVIPDETRGWIEREAALSLAE